MSDQPVERLVAAVLEQTREQFKAMLDIAFARVTKKQHNQQKGKTTMETINETNETVMTKPESNNTRDRVYNTVKALKAQGMIKVRMRHILGQLPDLKEKTVDHQLQKMRKSGQLRYVSVTGWDVA